MTVAELLKESLSLHRQAMPVTVGQGSRRRTSKTRDREKLRQAYELRKQAHALDPEHDDEAWADEQSVTPVGYDTHEMFMRFYRDQGLDG